MLIQDICRVTDSFDAKTHCDSRIYEYVMPTYLFRRLPIPPIPTEEQAKFATSHDYLPPKIELEEEEEEEEEENEDEEREKDEVKVIQPKKSRLQLPLNDTPAALVNTFPPLFPPHC